MSKEETGRLELWSETVDAEVYDDLLNRYERILLYAGQLQEKVRRQKLLEEKNRSSDKENARLKELVRVEQSYVRLLENALQSLGVFKPAPGGPEQ